MSSAHTYTVGSLLLQAVVLLGYAALSYIESLATTDPILFPGYRTIAIFFGVLGVIAIWLAGEYNIDQLRSSRLLIWVIFCIILSSIPLVLFTAMLFLYYSITSFVRMIQSIFFLIPSLFVYLFSRRDNPTRHELSNHEAC